MNDGYIMLLDQLIFNGVKIGNISADGIDWGGEKAEYIKLFAAQQRNGPVKKIRKKGATNILSFKLIELLPDNCKAVMGGTVSGKGWKAPSDSVTLEGPVVIKSGTGQTIKVAKMSLDGAVRGKLGGDEALGIDCELEMLQPSDGGSPFEIGETVPAIDANPKSLDFVKGGEMKVVNIDASGPFSISEAPTGFSVRADGGKISVTATPNGTTSPRNGKLIFTLKDHTEKSVTVSLTQSGT